MRLIDADDMRYEAVTLAGDDEVVLVIAKDDVDASPTVRCEDCRHWERDTKWEGHRACRQLDHGPGVWTRPDFGCVRFAVLEEKEEPHFNWTCPRCGSRHSSTETRCWCEFERRDDD